MKDIYTIYEGLLSGQDSTLAQGDAVAEHISKLHWTHKHSNALSGKLYYSLDEFMDKYFIREVYPIHTNIHNTVSNPNYKPNKTVRPNTIFWFIAYMLELDLGQTAESFDFSDTDKLTELFTEHFNKVLTKEGKEMLVFRVAYGRYKDLVELQIFEKNNPDVKVDWNSKRPLGITGKYYLSVIRAE